MKPIIMDACVVPVSLSCPAMSNVTSGYRFCNCGRKRWRVSEMTSAAFAKRVSTSPCTLMVRTPSMRLIRREAAVACERCHSRERDLLPLRRLHDEIVQRSELVAVDLSQPDINFKRLGRRLNFVDGGTEESGTNLTGDILGMQSQRCAFGPDPDVDFRFAETKIIDQVDDTDIADAARPGGPHWQPSSFPDRVP